MRPLMFGSLLILLASLVPPAHTQDSVADIRVGDRLQTLSNLHPDMKQHVLFTLNYQLPGLIPACSEVTVTQVHRKKLTFTFEGQQFELGYEGFTRNAGVSFQQAARNYLGTACDRAAIEKLSMADKEGLRLGRPAVGMSRAGVLLAMGRPPVHANPNLEASAWHYWKNRYSTMVVEFDDGEIVKNIQK